MDHIFREKVYESGGNGGSNTRERTNTTLGFGIAGTVLGAAALISKGGLSSLLGGGASGGGSSPVTVNYSEGSGNGCYGGYGGHGCSAFYAFSKECSDILNLTKTAYELKLGSMASAAQAREVDVNEKFGLYINNRDNIDRVNNRINDELFSLYKYTRDKDDETNNKIAALESQVAINTAIRPYQDKLIQCDIEKNFAWLKDYVDRKTCRMLEGIVTLPLEPTVTGVVSQTCCNRMVAAMGAGTGAGA